MEYKILKYEIVSKRKNKNNFRSDDNRHNIIMMVNTYNGHSKSIDCDPQTVKRYIARSCIKKCNIKEDYIIEKVKNEILNHFDNKIKHNSMDKQIIKNITLLEVSSIYKPYWVGNYNGKEVFVNICFIASFFLTFISIESTNIFFLLNKKMHNLN